MVGGKKEPIVGANMWFCMCMCAPMAVGRVCVLMYCEKCSELRYAQRTRGPPREASSSSPSSSFSNGAAPGPSKRKRRRRVDGMGMDGGGEHNLDDEQQSKYTEWN